MCQLQDGSCRARRLQHSRRAAAPVPVSPSTAAKAAKEEIAGEVRGSAASPPFALVESRGARPIEHHEAECLPLPITDGWDNKANKPKVVGMAPPAVAAHHHSGVTVVSPQHHTALRPAWLPTCRRPITDGWDNKANKAKVVGMAPPALRPAWLPTCGPGQAKVTDPRCWSLSLTQWLCFVRACVATETWKVLAKTKGEYNINMYDVNDHFVKPWTRGTGCSIALLMNATEQLPAEGMLSHAWAGSVLETHNCLQNMIMHSRVPSEARFFFCVFSLYQPEDGAPDGLSIEEQIALAPFAKIIASKPKHGMFVLHTTISEIYERLWVAHEADEGIAANIDIRGLFDMYRWTTERFASAADVETSGGKLGVQKDRDYIDGLIRQRGGYERLDAVIAKFRKKMLQDLSKLLEVKDEEEALPEDTEDHTFHRVYDWTFKQVYEYIDEDYQWTLRHAGGLPLGFASYPLGPPMSFSTWNVRYASGNFDDGLDSCYHGHQTPYHMAMGRACKNAMAGKPQQTRDTFLEVDATIGRTRTFNIGDYVATLNSEQGTLELCAKPST